MKLKKIDHKCIWSNEFHNAFTDIVRYEGLWFCSFREASSHMSLDGRARVLKSEDGERWELLGSLSWAGGDVRDPKFSIDSAGQLLIHVGVRLAVPSKRSEAIFSTSWVFVHNQFHGPFVCDTSSGTWRWSTSWCNHHAYSVGYSGKDRERGSLYISKNGLDWRVLKRPFFPSSDCFSNEASIAFDKNDVAYCLLRRDSFTGCSAVLGKSKPPYVEWDWVDLGVSIGGPKLLFLSSGELLAAFRLVESQKIKTVVAQITLDGKCKILLELTSEGDASYPGMFEYQGEIWVSYYSSHNGSTSIYVTRLKIQQPIFSILNFF